MRKNFTKLLVLGTVFLSVHSYGQNDPYYTHYMLNKLAFNPAAAGEKDAICVNGLTHQQWLGQRAEDPTYDPRYNPTGGQGIWFNGVNPVTNAFSITAPLLKNNQLGVGFQVITDQLGYHKNTYMRGSLAYKLRMGRKLPDGSTDQTLAIGADFGLAQVQLDGTKYNPLQSGDPQIPTSLVSGGAFDMGAGIYYTHQRLFDGFYAGVSMTHLTGPTISVPGNINFTANRYLYALAGSRHDFGSLAIMPSILVKALGAPLQVDLGIRGMLNDKLVGGLNLRSGDAISLLLGYYVMPNLYVGYSYDITVLSGVSQYIKSGTHELFVSYCFDIKTPPPSGPKPKYNVRYLEGYTLY
ncbi:MAG: type IX secretion system membrane protein PorP/SprF [Bacteroidota bacterium]|nr:type IX secretion system membrane protein PorP/SprF [Bacteroidota bacterium]MDX5430967.1 type IX secretion system membrane protein PorP/SprF [Bacteroidota bacterium]MDX5469718.1 type IX secretion system membrane protein PorP/SprF [Bacteroidota bacterium]